MLPSRHVFQQQAERPVCTPATGWILARLRRNPAPLASWFEHALDAVRKQGFDEAFIRMWRLYLCYCEAGFDENSIGVSQFLLQEAQPCPRRCCS
jgi:cyclopropane-fatty-acyl-phospholipid synthase